MEKNVSKFMNFSYNYRHDFIELVWEDNPTMASHLRSKFGVYYSKYGPMGVMAAFYSGLDNENREKLCKWVDTYYKG